MRRTHVLYAYSIYIPKWNLIIVEAFNFKCSCTGKEIVDFAISLEPPTIAMLFTMSFKKNSGILRLGNTKTVGVTNPTSWKLVFRSKN